MFSCSEKNKMKDAWDVDRCADQCSDMCLPVGGSVCMLTVSDVWCHTRLRLQDLHLEEISRWRWDGTHPTLISRHIFRSLINRNVSACVTLSKHSPAPLEVKTGITRSDVQLVQAKANFR